MGCNRNVNISVKCKGIEKIIEELKQLEKVTEQATKKVKLSNNKIMLTKKQVAHYVYNSNKSNNWRKMHGFSMRRKVGK